MPQNTTEAKASLREVVMIEKALLWFLAIGVLWLIGCKLQDLYEKELELWIRRKRLQKNVKVVLSNAVSEYARRYGHENLVATHLWRNGQTSCNKSMKEFQRFLNQVLKMYAGDLQRAYDKEDELRKRCKSRDNNPDSYSQEQIELFLKSYKEVILDKDCAEKRFWQLHDTLDVLGLETWGHMGYKVYVCLNPLPPMLTLSRLP